MCSDAAFLINGHPRLNPIKVNDSLSKYTAFSHAFQLSLYCMRNSTGAFFVRIILIVSILAEIIIVMCVSQCVRFDALRCYSEVTTDRCTGCSGGGEVNYGVYGSSAGIPLMMTSN